MMADHRKNEFKKTVTSADGRRRRAETTVKIRKEKRQQQLKKKREHASGLRSPDVQQHQPESCLNTAKIPKPTVADIPRLKAVLLNNNASELDKIEAARGFRRMLSVEENIPAPELVDNDIVPLLVQNLSLVPTTSPVLIFESAWALTNIASTDRTLDVVNANAIKPLVSLLVHNDSNVREQVAWCLGNIAGEGPDLRDQILQQSPMQSLVMNLNNPSNMQLLENFVWTVSNLCRGTPSPAMSVTAPVIYPIVSLLDKPISETAIVDALWCLSYLSDGDEQRIETVLATGVTKKLILLLQDPATETKWKTPIVRILGNFVSGNDSQTQAVIDAGILDYLEQLMSCSSKMIRKESTWLASNIACGSIPQISELVKKTNAMNRIVVNASDDLWEVRKEALWALSNICTTGNDMHVVTLVELGGLEPLVRIIGLGNTENQLLISVIDALKQILSVGEDQDTESFKTQIAEWNGIDYLEELQSHPSNTVYEKVVSIIEDYFGIDEEEDENLAPVTCDSGTFGFGIASPKQLFANNFSSDLPYVKEHVRFGTVSTNIYSM